MRSASRRHRPCRNVPFLEEQTIFYFYATVAITLGLLTSIAPVSAAGRNATPAFEPPVRSSPTETLQVAEGVPGSIATVAKPNKLPSDVLRTISFTDYDQSSVKDWLAGKGFALKGDADDPSKIGLDASRGGLVVETKKGARALLVYDRSDVPDVNKIRITWQVDQYPPGANYDNGVRNEALMVMVFFGQDRIASGSPFVPDSPFFIGLFLCGEGSVRKPHIGRYFKQGGRYVCVDQPQEGETIVSEYDLSAGFKEMFAPNALPTLSGIAIQADTTVLKSAGKSKGTIKSVEFLK